MIRITRTIALDDSEVREEFIHASGPGGQNVNKIASAVKLRFDVAGSHSLPEEVRERLVSLAGKRVSADGILTIDARRFRTQERNREDAMGRLVTLVREAAQKPKVRRQTRPTLASKMRRLEGKHHSAETKQARGPVPPNE